MGLDLDLSPQLVLHALLLHLGLEQTLQCNHCFRLLLSCHIDVSKLALAQRSTDVKVLDTDIQMKPRRDISTRYKT